MKHYKDWASSISYTILLLYSYGLQEVLEVVHLANRFNFTLLKEAIGIQLADRISLKNVLELLVHADFSHVPELHEKCLQFVDQNAEEILKSDAFLSLPAHNLQCVISRDTFLVPEVSIFQAVLKWKEHNSSVSEEVKSEVLQCIRLSEVSPQEIFQVVEPSGMFDESKLFQAVRVQMKSVLKQMHPRGKTGL